MKKRSMKTIYLRFIWSILFFITLNACGLGAIVGVTATTAAVSALQDKTLSQSMSDTHIWYNINKSLLSIGSFSDVRVTVDSGKVLLLGNVYSTRERLNLTKLVWEQNGVVEVINDVEINQREESFIKSTWLTTQVKSKLIMSVGVRSVNYSVETMNGVVYIMGIAKNKRELEKALDAVSNVNGVVNVVSYVRTKDSN